MAKKYLELNGITAYQISSELSDYLWDLVTKWEWFAKKTLGIQLVRSTDSTPANIAEGYGRYHKKDKIKFYYNARASLHESIFWREKAYKRSLISFQEYNYIKERQELLPREINILIKLTGDNLEK